MHQPVDGDRPRPYEATDAVECKCSCSCQTPEVEDEPADFESLLAVDASNDSSTVYVRRQEG